MSTRDAIRMSPDETRAFLAEPHELQLAMLNRDGTPREVCTRVQLGG